MVGLFNAIATQRPTREQQKKNTKNGTKHDLCAAEKKTNLTNNENSQLCWSIQIVNHMNVNMIFEFGGLI